jgi:hypothetical protein
MEGCGERLGCCDLSDGEWVWPQRFEHYVEAHEVCLPDEFVEVMQSRGWQAPTEIDGDQIGLLLDRANEPFGDLSYWLSWSANFHVRSEQQAD